LIGCIGLTVEFNCVILVSCSWIELLGCVIVTVCAVYTYYCPTKKGYFLLEALEAGLVPAVLSGK